LFQRLICPRTNSVSFGQIDILKLDNLIFPSAPINLFSGRHTGANKGFGAHHIWAEHQKEMARIGLNSCAEVPYFVERIVAPNTPVHFEGGSFRTTRLIAVRSSAGTAILEWRDQREGAVWSIVTAFLTPRASGKLVGRIQ
jgi:hypothetical protein